jgi:hypothetical protein
MLGVRRKAFSRITMLQWHLESGGASVGIFDRKVSRLAAMLIIIHARRISPSFVVSLESAIYEI